MMRFEYYEPKSIVQAISFANHLPGETKWLAGGTELLPKLKQRAFKAEHIINLKKIPELGGISQNDSVTRIGSLTTLEELATSKLVTRSFPALSEAAFWCCYSEHSAGSDDRWKPVSSSELRLFHSS